MYVAWDPETEGEEKKEWNFDPDDVPRRDAMLIEKHYDGSWDQWVMGLQMGKIDARSVLLWYMIYLHHPKYRFDDLPNFRVRQLIVQMGVAELKRLFKQASRLKLTPDQREAFEAQMIEDVHDALLREGKSGEVDIVDGQLIIEDDGGDLPKPASPDKHELTG